MIRCGKSLAPSASGFPKFSYPTCALRKKHEGPCSSALGQEGDACGVVCPGLVSHDCELAPGHVGRHHSGDVRWKNEGLSVHDLERLLASATPLPWVSGRYGHSGDDERLTIAAVNALPQLIERLRAEIVPRVATPVTCDVALDGVRRCQRQVGHEGEHSVDSTECVPASLPAEPQCVDSPDALRAAAERRTGPSSLTNPVGRPKCGKFIGKNDACTLDEGHVNECGHPGIIAMCYPVRDGYREEKLIDRADRLPPVDDPADYRAWQAFMSDKNSAYRVPYSRTWRTAYDYHAARMKQWGKFHRPCDRLVAENGSCIGCGESSIQSVNLLVCMTIGCTRSRGEHTRCISYDGHYIEREVTEFDVKLPAHPKVASHRTIVSDTHRPTLEHPQWRVLRSQLDLVESLADVAKLGDDADCRRVVVALVDLEETARMLREKLS